MKSMPELHIHAMAVDTSWLEPVLDDGYTIVEAKVDNGDFGNSEHNQVRLCVLDESTSPRALAWGGLLVFANVPKQALYQSILVGLRALVMNGQLTPGDVLDHDGKED